MNRRGFLKGAVLSGIAGLLGIGAKVVEDELPYVSVAVVKADGSREEIPGQVCHSTPLTCAQVAQIKRDWENRYIKLWDSDMVLSDYGAVFMDANGDFYYAGSLGC